MSQVQRLGGRTASGVQVKLIASLVGVQNLGEIAATQKRHLKLPFNEMKGVKEGNGGTYRWAKKTPRRRKT